MINTATSSPSTLYPSSVWPTPAPVPNNHLPLNLFGSPVPVCYNSRRGSDLYLLCGIGSMEAASAPTLQFSAWVGREKIENKTNGFLAVFLINAGRRKEFVILISGGLEWKSASLGLELLPWRFRLLIRIPCFALESGKGMMGSGKTTYSESFFRDNESKALRKLSLMRQLVVATGGGVVIRPINWKYMKQGITVWLDVPLEASARRIAAVGTDSHPLLHEESGDAYSKRHWYKSSIL
ncbi:hypothetical protein NE237_024581 [Protea cynaroides]|uniref:Shikimate kinase n=1 Tax=Protea cynaroides TaxID=273540 RepID=A0A9Q0K0J6_9MAGN|nr:hypothetical protein NE237_024581 [Protea cynaroides]